MNEIIESERDLIVRVPIVSEIDYETFNTISYTIFILMMVWIFYTAITKI